MGGGLSREGTGGERTGFGRFLRTTVAREGQLEQTILVPARMVCLIACYSGCRTRTQRRKDTLLQDGLEGGSTTIDLTADYALARRRLFAKLDGKRTFWRARALPSFAPPDAKLARRFGQCGRPAPSAHHVRRAAL